MHMLVSWFLDDEIAFKGDCLEILDKHREDFIDWRPNWDLYVFLIKQAFPQTSSSVKTIDATTKEIEEHYDRGNDFFAAFLGPAMVLSLPIAAPACSHSHTHAQCRLVSRLA